MIRAIFQMEKKKIATSICIFLFITVAIRFLAMYADLLQHGWTVDPASQMLTVKKQPIVTEKKLDPSKLQRLTEYVFHLEH